MGRQIRLGVAGVAAALALLLTGGDDDPRVAGRDGGPSDPGALRRRVLVPAATHAGLSGVGFHTLRHTCASLLIDSGLNVLRLQRWMGDVVGVLVALRAAHHDAAGVRHSSSSSI
jgi:integrase